MHWMLIKEEAGSVVMIYIRPGVTLEMLWKSSKL